MARLGTVINLSILLKSTKIISVGQPDFLKTRFLISYVLSQELCVINEYTRTYEVSWYPTKNPKFIITWSDITMTYSYDKCEVIIKINGKINVRTPTYTIIDLFESIYRLRNAVEKHYARYKDLLLESTDITNIAFAIFRIDYLFRLINHYSWPIQVLLS